MGVLAVRVVERLADQSDVLFAGVAQGDVLYRGASAWNNLPPGTAGFVLTTNGAGADPTWTPSAAGSLAGLSDVTFTGIAQGDVLYRNATEWVNLGPGTSGQFLKTQGAGANPVWDTVAAGMAIGGAISGGTAGSVLFVDASGNLGQDNANFQWVDADNSLILAATPPLSATKANLLLGGALSGGSAAGTYLGMNGASGFTGNLVELQANNQMRIRFSSTGRLNIDAVDSSIIANIAPVAATGGFFGQQFQIDTNGLSGNSGWTGIMVDRTGALGFTGTSRFIEMRNAGAACFLLSSVAEIIWKPISLTGFGAMQFDGANTSATYGFLRATNAQDGISFRNALSTDDGSGVGFRFSVTTTAAYSGVTNLGATVLSVENGQVGGSPHTALFSVTAGGMLSGQRYDAVTGSISQGLVLAHNSSGTPGAGFGGEARMTLQSSTTADRDAAGLSWEWVTATDATRAARGKVLAYDTAARECIRFEASGAAPMVGFLGTAAAIQQTGGAATAGGTYTAAEAAMLQAAYDCLRTFGLLS